MNNNTTKDRKPEVVTFNMLQPYLPEDEDIIKIFAGRREIKPDELSAIIAVIITVIRYRKDGSYYIYNKAGFYEPLPNWLLSSLFKHIVTVGGIQWSSKFENAVLSIFKRDTVEAINEFNSQNIINFSNGTLELDTGLWRKHNPKTDYFTSVLSYEYNEKAECPMFLNFMKQICLSDEDLEAVLQEILGYALSTRVDAEVAFFFYGGGCNGKSVLSSIIHSLVGEENTCAVPLEALAGAFSTAAFIGKKMNISGENGELVNAEKLKTLISADRINVPIKYQEDWVGTLYAKHIFLMNDLPSTPDITYGFMRKIIIIPFKYQVSPEDMDRDLTNKLKSELSGIFNYCYEGYQRLRANDFVFTKAKMVEDQKKEYMNRENPTGRYFNNTFEKEVGAKVLRSRLYPLFEQWCVATGNKTMSKRKFFQALESISSDKDYAIELEVKKHNGYYYLMNYKEKEKSMTEIIDFDEIED